MTRTIIAGGRDLPGPKVVDLEYCRARRIVRHLIASGVVPATLNRAIAAATADMVERAQRKGMRVVRVEG